MRSNPASLPDGNLVDDSTSAGYSEALEAGVDFTDCKQVLVELLSELLRSDGINY